jgi:hypothetical protein
MTHTMLGYIKGRVVNATPKPFTGSKYPLLIAQEVDWALGPVWAGRENLAPPGVRTPERPALSGALYLTTISRSSDSSEH